jgi:hypothetical protein
MAGEMIVGTSLVLLSWAAGVVLVVALGRWLAILVQPAAQAAPIRRASLWWGLLVAVALTLAINLLVPLRSAAAAALFLSAAAALAAVGLLLRRPRHRSSLAARKTTRPILAMVAALAVAAGYLAFKAIGPATNYDTGLYHLGAIKYAGDYTTIPGLATLYFPFGYSNAQFPLAALLGNGPWQGVGYRLLNGLLVALVMTDVVVRLISRRYTWGTFVIAVGLGASLVPLVALSDFLVTSPTADTAILLLTLVSSAYLADFLGSPRDRALNASVVAATVVTMVSLRPTTGFFAVASIVVVALGLRQQRSWPGLTRPALLTVAGAVIVLGTLQVLRDRLLSGWLLYPLSLFAFDVPWRADDPTVPREATLAAARDAFNPDQFSVAHSWSWIPIWIGRLWGQWETYFVLVGVAVTCVSWLLARRHGKFPRHPRRLAAAMLPSGIAIIGWFVLSPPSFRFIWGPLFCLVFIPLGAALHALHHRRPSQPGRLHGTTGAALLAVAAAILLVTGYSVVARNQAAAISQPHSWTLGPIAVPYAIAPIPLPPVVPITMTSGLVLITPESGDQCWDNYPLCSFNMGDDVALRGSSIQDGFIRQ